MKLLFDFFPIILFFGIFKYAENHKDWAATKATDWLGFMVSGGVVAAKDAPVLLATSAVILATLLQILWLLINRRRIDPMLWVSFGLITVLGGATIWFHSETFIKWKPSALYWVMGLSCLVSQFIFKKNLIKSLLGKQINPPDHVWRNLNFAWIAFFMLMGLLNIYIAYNFTTDIWVNFKLFGGLGLMLAFLIAQGFYLSPYLKNEEHS